MKDLKPSKLLIFIYAIFLYPIVINRISMICYALIYGLPLVYLFINFGYVDWLLRRMRVKFATVILGVIFLLLLSIIVPGLLGTWDLSYVNVTLAILRKFIIVLFLVVITIKVHRENSQIQLFMYYYIVATCCYVLGTCLFLAFPQLKSAWQSVIGTTDFIDNLFASYGYAARFGWSGFSGYRSTLDCTTAFIFSMCLFFEKEDRYSTKTLFFIITILLTFLGNLFYGRSGIIASGVCFIIGIILYHRVNIKQILTFLIAFAVFAFAIISVKNRIPVLNEWYTWATTPIFNFLTTGSFNNYSASHILNDMIFMPDGSTLLHGDGLYTEAMTGLHYMHTDVGFMRQILFWGIGGTALTYIMVIHSTFLLNSKHRVLQLLYLIVFAMFEFKGEVYYEIIPIVFLLGLWESKYSLEYSSNLRYSFKISKPVIRKSI